MTKTAIIEYNEADETLLQLFFEKLRVKVKATFDIDNGFEDPQKLTDFFKKHKLSKKNKQFFRELYDSLQECYAIERGEIEPEQTYEEYLTELKAIANANPTLETV